MTSKHVVGRALIALDVDFGVHDIIEYGEGQFDFTDDDAFVDATESMREELLTILNNALVGTKFSYVGFADDADFATEAPLTYELK